MKPKIIQKNEITFVKKNKWTQYVDGLNNENAVLVANLTQARCLRVAAIKAGKKVRINIVSNGVAVSLK